MSRNLEYRAREKQRKRESGWQASEAQREKGRQRSRAREQHDNFEKMRNASGHQCKVKVNGSEKK